MDYDFSKRERGFGKIVFALCLDKKKMTERILIGEANEVRQKFDNDNGDILYDEVRPLGQLLIDFEADKDRRWNTNAMQLHNSYNKVFPFDKERWKIADKASKFLKGKYSKGEPSAMFAAIRTWEDYLNCYNQNHGGQMFIDKTSILYRAFSTYGEYRQWQEEAINALSKMLHDSESQVELWYPMKKRSLECVVVTASFLPLIFYYMHKVEEWGFVFQECKACGKYFIARSRHFEVCGDECRKVQAVEAKRQFDERAKGDMLEQLHESAYFYWYNRLRKLKNKKVATEKIATVNSAFKKFRDEAKTKKSEVKQRKIKLPDFSSWLVEQQKIIDLLMEELLD